MGGGGSTPLNITQISPGSPVSSRPDESRTFKAKVNKSNTIVKWKLDGNMVFAHQYPPANTELSYSTVAPSESGSHVLKIQAEKNGLTVSKTWIWYVDETVGNGQSSPSSNSFTENAVIAVDNAILYRRFDGTYYVEVHWSSLVCEGYRSEDHTSVTSCDQHLQFVVSWQVITYPGDPEPSYFEQGNEVSGYCAAVGTEVIELPPSFMNSSPSVRINLTVDCHLLKYFIPVTLPGSAFVSCSLD